MNADILQQAGSVGKTSQVHGDFKSYCTLYCTFKLCGFDSAIVKSCL